WCFRRLVERPLGHHRVANRPTRRHHHDRSRQRWCARRILRQQWVFWKGSFGGGISRSRDLRSDAIPTYADD
ncbi:hypothetical protein BN1723_019236, partial [Verticillium longisporum]